MNKGNRSRSICNCRLRRKIAHRACRGGRLLSIDRTLSSVDREALARRHDAVALDQTSFAVASICRREKTRFLCVRIVSDAVSDVLPRDLQRAKRQKTAAARWGAALAAVVHRPSSLKDVFDSQQQALEDADRLARFLEGVVVQLAQPAPAP